MTKHRVDSHQHFWQLSRGDYSWLTPDLERLYRDFLPCDITTHLIESNIDQTVVVQAAPSDAETEFLLELAAANDFIAGVVGWVDMQAPSAAKRLKALATNPYFKGIRPMIQDIGDDDWMLGTNLNTAFETLIELDLTFDALVHPRHLKYLLELLKRYPELRCVVNHGAKPAIADETWQPWADDLATLAADTTAHCKLSGLVTEAGPHSSYEHLKPYLVHLLNTFGGERLMWASDWPVLTLASDYLTWYSMALIFIRETEPSIEAEIMGGTASRFYRLEPKEVSS